MENTLYGRDLKGAQVNETLYVLQRAKEGVKNDKVLWIEAEAPSYHVWNHSE